MKKPTFQRDVLKEGRSFLIRQHGPLPKTPWNDYDIVEISNMLDDAASIIREFVRVTAERDRIAARREAERQEAA